MINYSDEECRIASYGDSFTQCHQVSDGETWQETLAAHIGEPIRNFGVGGYGVYQAYLRLRRTELDVTGGASYVLSISTMTTTPEPRCVPTVAPRAGLEGLRPVAHDFDVPREPMGTPTFRP